MKLKIVSDGLGRSTKVVDAATGERLDNVTRIDIMPITPRGTVNAILHVDLVSLDIDVPEGVFVPVPT